AAKEMNEALLINPNNFEQIANTLKRALEMSKDEQIRRNSILQKRLERYSVEKWAQEFMKSLHSTRKSKDVYVSKKMTSSIEKDIFQLYKKEKNKLILLDYDGTLVNFEKDRKSVV